MIKAEVRIPEGADLKGAVRLVERLCAEEGLTRRVKRTMRAYPGSVHWHFGNGKSPGTLEVTYLREAARLWLSVHANREGPWTRATVRKLRLRMEKEFGNLAKDEKVRARS